MMRFFDGDREQIGADHLRNEAIKAMLMSLVMLPPRFFFFFGLIIVLFKLNAQNTVKNVLRTLDCIELEF